MPVRHGPNRPVAVVYSDGWTGPTDGDDTGAVAAMLAASRWNFRVITAGPNGELSVRKALARPDVRLYAQPGADGDDEAAFRRQKGDKAAIRSYVDGGGRYLGVCMGGFLAEPGFFHLFRGRVDEYYSSPGASVTTPEPAVVTVRWRGVERDVFFQDGGFMVPKRKNSDVTVLARYPNGAIAALVAPFGRGRVGLCGPHPEAPPAWFHDAGLGYVGSNQDLGDDLIDSVMGC